MSTPELYVEGKRLVLSKKLGQGGEGTVYGLSGIEDKVVKHYTLSGLGDREAKVKAMIQLRLADKSPQTGFPKDPVYDRRGKFCGFTMKSFSGYKPIHDLYSIKSRKQEFPKADYRFIVHTALNIARSMASIHSLSCVIGDINHSGILVSESSIAAIIDADSFQLKTNTSQFLCEVGVQEYTPPELQGRSLSGVKRSANHDNFGLAVIIFQLLFMGRHPFAGTPVSGDMPLDKAITEFRYAYSNRRLTGLSRPPGVCSSKDFPQQVADGFERAFDSAGVNSRPTADEWTSMLTVLKGALSLCTKNRIHYYPSAAGDCCWCSMESTIGISLFEAQISDASNRIGFDPKDLNSVVAALNAINLPTRDSISPQYKPLSLEPSEAAKKVPQKRREKNIQGVFMLLGAGGLFLLAPELFIFSIILAAIGVGFIANNQSGVSNSQEFVASYIRAREDYDNELNTWFSRIGYDEAERSKVSLKNGVQEYSQLGDERKREIERYKVSRRNAQLIEYLDRFRISNATIKSIGPTKVAALESWGIETAADVNKSKILRISGFGPVYTDNIMSWRRNIESKFSYDPKPNNLDTQKLTKIDSDIGSKALKLKATLASGVKDLQGTCQSIQAQSRRLDEELAIRHKAIIQAETDIKFLGIPLPAYQTKVTTQPQGQVPAKVASSTGRAQTSGGQLRGATYQPACPSCGGPMQIRTAGRGWNAGKKFWGCKRYPACKGIVNI